MTTDLEYLKSSLRWVVRDINKEFDKESPDNNIIWNLRLIKSNIEREITKITNTPPKSKVIPEMETYAETIEAFCGFY